MYPRYTACCCSSPRALKASCNPVVSHVTLSRSFAICGAFSFDLLDIFGVPKLIQDLQNAQKLCRRAILLSGSLFLCILWLYIPHGSHNASVMAATAVVSVAERSIDFIVALVAPGEKSIFKTLLMVIFFSKLSLK